MTEDSALAIPTSVRERRKRLKWTQEKLAAEAGISTTAVHNLEAGKNGFSDKSLAALARVLDCHPSALLLPLDVAEPPIQTETQILAALARIEKLTDKDISTAFAVIKNALDAKRAVPEPSEPRGQPQPSTPLHVSAPSHRKVPQ